MGNLQDSGTRVARIVHDSHGAILPVLANLNCSDYLTTWIRMPSFKLFHEPSAV
jgi:hypothetical protein